MSIEKVRRYEVHVEHVFSGVSGTSYGRARQVEHPEGRYIEYADVAGLVEALSKCLDALREIVMAGNSIDLCDHPARGHMRALASEAQDTPRNELARWTV